MPTQTVIPPGHEALTRAGIRTGGTALTASIVRHQWGASPKGDLGGHSTGSDENVGVVEIRPERPDDFPPIREIISETMRTRWLPSLLTLSGRARATSPNSAGWRSLPLKKSSVT